MERAPTRPGHSWEFESLQRSIDDLIGKVAVLERLRIPELQEQVRELQRGQRRGPATKAAAKARAKEAYAAGWRVVGGGAKGGDAP